MAKIDFSDIPEITPEILKKTRVRKNPYYESLMKHGFSITVHYGPEDAKAIADGIADAKRSANLFEMDDEELAALERYKKAQLCDSSRGD